MKANILSVQQCEALTVVQLNTQPCNTFEYITLTKAMKQNLIEIRELNQSGSVNEVYVINKSRHFVFMTDGDVLSGAKQNRVLNTSVLLLPESKTVLPVSCVEQGRWSYASEKFSSTDYVIPINMRAAKSNKVMCSMRSSKSFRADQGEVWDKVAQYSSQMNVTSESNNFSDVFDQRQSAYAKFLNVFQCHQNANGLAFFIKKELKNIDVFNRTEVYEEYFPKLIKGASLDVYGLNYKEKMTDAEVSFKTLDMLDKLETLNPETHQGVSAGNEKRFGSDEASGFELNYNGHLIHLSAHAGAGEQCSKNKGNHDKFPFI